MRGAAILTLALGIGANTAIFSLVNAMLLQHLPVQNRDRASYLFAGRDWAVASYPSYIALRDGARLLDGLAAWGGIEASLNADGETDVVGGVIVTGNVFDVLGLSASHGRLLSTSDDVTPMGHPVAVISHRLWQGRFGGRADIVGSQIRLNGHSFTIVGVTPPAFPGPQLGAVRHSDIYVPTMMQPLVRPPRAGYSGEMNPDLLKNPDNGWLFQMALRKHGVTDEQAAAELSALATTYLRTRSATAPEPRLTLVPIDAGNPTQRSQMRSVATLLGCVVGAVLLIACANVANLLLSRAAARRREVAIRLALGASRWRIVRQLLTESLLLATIGGAAGLLVAWLVVEGFEAAPPPPGALPVALDFALDARVLLFTFALSVLTGVVFGVAPALQTSRPDLVPALKQEGLVPDCARAAHQPEERARRRRGGTLADAAHCRRAVHSQPGHGSGGRAGLRGGPARVDAAERSTAPLHPRAGPRVLSARHRAHGADPRSRVGQRRARRRADGRRPNASPSPSKAVRIPAVAIRVKGPVSARHPDARRWRMSSGRTSSRRSAFRS